MFRPESTSGRESTNRTQNTTEDRIRSETQDKEKTEEVRNKIFALCGIVTVTFRLLALFVVTKCYSYSMISLQLTVVPPAEYPRKRFL
jgi:hypothetical protein